MNSSSTVNLGDIATIHDSKRVPLNSRERSLRKGAIPYYGAQGIVDYIDDHLFDGDYVLIAEDGENLRSRKQPVAFRARGKFWVNNHAHIVQGRKPWLNDYIEAFFHYTDISPYVTGAAQPKLNQANLLKIQIPFVENTAKESAVLWSLLQRKIELNRRMNETLEQIGQTLFKHYFVDNPKSDSWQDGTVSDLINVYSGYAFKRDVFDSRGDYGLVTIKNVQDGFFVEECTDHISTVPANVPDYCYVKRGDILLSLTGNVGRVCLVTKNNLLLNQRVAKLSGVQKDSNCFAYFMFRNQDFKDKLISISRGTAQMNLSPVETKQIKTKVPSEEVMVEFTALAKPIFELHIQNSVESSTLAKVRDLLLPKLISGQISV